MLQTVRKFGLEYCDMPTMMWNVSVFLRVLLLNIDIKYTKGIPFYFYIITIFMFGSNFYVYFVSMVWFVCIKSPQTGNLVAAMVVLCLGACCEIGTVKLFSMFLYINKIRNLTNNVLVFDSQTVPGSRLSTNLLKYLRTVKKRAIIYWTVIMGNGILYVISPFFLPGRHLTEDNYIIYGLEPMFESPNYELAVVMMAAGVLITVYISSNVTGYLIVIIGYFEAYMLAIGEEVNHLWCDAEENYIAKVRLENIPDDVDTKNRIINECIRESLKDIIRRHVIIKELFNQCEEVFRGAIAIGLVILILGLLSDLLGGLENTYMQLPFVSIQVGIDCFVGQKIMDAGEIFERAVYNCKWENFDKTNMQMVLMMLTISQKTMAISAGGITSMSFECLMAALRATYSAYTTLRSVM